MDDFLWWRDGIIYQIYPRSFFDSNGDGLGDLPGITSRLDYLADLGIDAIWLSPIYPSPDADFGYDVSNYTDIDPRFGTLADFTHLLTEAHARGIRVVLDLVLNHTSDQHPWFRESKSSRDNPKADWYIWRDTSSKGDARAGVPNNWQSVFGGRGWTYAPERGQYYYHMFLKEQPDVNWRNPEMRKALLDVVRFWLERGVDGFRLDVFNVYFKDDQFRDNPPKFGLRAFDRQRHIYDVDQPEMLLLLNELRAIPDSYPERYAVGETFLATAESAAGYVGRDRLHAAFSFDFTSPTFFFFHPLSPAWIAKKIMRREQIFKGERWPTTVMSNHDIPRAASWYAPADIGGGRGEDDTRSKIAMTLLLTLRGTPFLYYGEEIGMRNISLKHEQLLDPVGRRYWPLPVGRDGCRSPMQWDDSANAGFSATMPFNGAQGMPWLPVHPDYRRRNVAAQRENPYSLYNFTRTLIALRKEYFALRRGEFIPLAIKPHRVLAYLRCTEKQTVLVALNFTSRCISFSPPEGNWQVLLSTDQNNSQNDTSPLRLSPHEVRLLIRR